MIIPNLSLSFFVMCYICFKTKDRSLLLRMVEKRGFDSSFTVEPLVCRWFGAWTVSI